MRRAILLAMLTVTWLAASPTASAADYPLTPDPADCDAAPIDIDALVLRVATPVPAATPEVVAERRIASLSLQNDLTAVVLGSVACMNANQPLRALSYFTDDYLVSRISDEPAVTLGHLKAASTRQPGVAPVEDRVTIEVIEMSTVWDGGAEVVLLWSSGDEKLVRSGLRFREVDGAWKIDSVLGDTVG